MFCIEYLRKGTQKLLALIVFREENWLSGRGVKGRLLVIHTFVPFDLCS